VVVTLGLVIILAAVIVITVVLIVTAAVVVVIAPVFMLVIVAALVMGSAGSPFSFFSIDVSICCLYLFADGCGPLVVQLSMELLVPKPFGESDNGLGINNVGNRVSCLQEAPDEVTQGLLGGLMKLLQVILGARLLARSHVIVGEDFLKVFPRLFRVLP